MVKHLEEECLLKADKTLILDDKVEFYISSDELELVNPNEN